MKYRIPVLSATAAALICLAPVSASAHSSYYFGFSTGPACYPARVAYVAPPPVYVVPRPVVVYPVPYAYRPWGYGSFSFGYWHH